MGLSLPFRRRSGLSADSQPLSFDEWLGYFRYGGVDYPILNQTLVGDRETIGADFAGYVGGAYRSSGIVFACIAARMLFFSEARFQFRGRNNGRPGDLFGTQELAVLETPWPGGTTADLLARCELDVSIAGNAYIARSRGANRVSRLRPDWVTIVMGSPNDADSGPWDPEAEVLGYSYQPGGPGSGYDPVDFLPDEVAHYAPIPDPCSPVRGVSWLAPAITDLLADKAMTKHRLRFFEQGATPNMVVKTAFTDEKKFEAWVNRFRAGSEGAVNAFKTLFLMQGADAAVVGKDLKELDFQAVQSYGETRIAAAARVPPTVLGLDRALVGSSLNAGNYEAIMGSWANLWARPSWRNLAGSLSRIIAVPAGAELWYDDRDIPALQAAEKDRAEAVQTKATSISTLVAAGYDPETVVEAVNADDLTLLEHTGLVSVQLLPPGTANGNGNGNGGTPDKQGALMFQIPRRKDD